MSAATTQTWIAKTAPAPANMPPTFRCWRCHGSFADTPECSDLAIEACELTGWAHCDECAEQYFEAA